MDDVGRLPPFVVRVAGLPLEAVARLRCGGTAGLVDELVAEEEWLRGEGQAPADRLHDLIGGVGGSPLKPRLVGLRRALHRVRRPAASEWSPEVRAGLPAAVGRRVDGWLVRLRGWQEARERLPRVLAAETARAAVALREVAAEPAFRRALWLSSQALFEELDKWLADPDRLPREQVLTRLAKYLARAATKTSPYGTFMVSGLGTWTEDGPLFRLADGWETRTVLELYGPIRELLRGRLAREPALSGASLVRANDAYPVTLRQLGELLYRCARNRGRGTVAGVEQLSRPYPSGGALYELEIFPVVRLVAGLAAGMYHYDPERHRLARVCGPNQATGRLLRAARRWAGAPAQPQVLLVIAARFGRVMWKYQGMAYALILKHVGVLYQTIYLVAAAMGLAACGLGLGEPDAFAEATGRDPLVEGTVGELMLGSRALGGKEVTG